MAHPHKSEVKDTHNAKLRSMTTHYGLAEGPATNITTPGERLKGEGSEKHVGFGADSSNEGPSRGDRSARRSAAANPVPTYARGGTVKKADGGVITRARGGRAKHKGATHVNVMVAPQSAPPPATGPSPQLAALAAGAAPKPPMPIPPPGPGGPPMMPPGAGGPPPSAMPMRARGGKVSTMGGNPTAGDEMIEHTMREEGLIKKARGGGVHMTAGAITGIGRLEKMGIKESHRGSLKPKEV